MMAKDLLLITGFDAIRIINVNNYEFIGTITVPEVGPINGVCMLNQNMLLTGDWANTIRQWRIEGDNLILVSKKENAHDDHITVLLNPEINNKSFDIIINGLILLLLILDIDDLIFLSFISKKHIL